MSWQAWTNDMEDVGGGQATPWDRLKIGGKTMPGVVTVSASAAGGWDIQKPKDRRRAYTEDNGDEPMRFDISVVLRPIEAQEFRKEIVPLLRPRDKKSGRPPLEAEHPMLEMWGVGIIVIDDIKVGHPESGGLMRVSLTAIEYAKPEPVKKKKKPVTEEKKDQHDEAAEGPLFKDFKDDPEMAELNLLLGNFK